MPTTKELLEFIISVNIEYESLGKFPIRPCLYGPSAAGKTAIVLQCFPNCYTLIVQGKQEAQIFGLPIVDSVVSAFQIPVWASFPQVFIDELDKADIDAIGTILTFLAQRKYHNRVYSGQIITAMQPVERDWFLQDETHKALGTRLVFLPVNFDWNYVSEETGYDCTELPTVAIGELPVLPHPTPRQVSWFLFCVDRCPIPRKNIQEFRDFLQPIMNGLFHNKWHPVLWKIIEEFKVREGVSGDVIVNSIKKFGPEAVEKLEIPQIIAIGADWWLHGTTEIFLKVMEKLYVEGCANDIFSFWSNIYDSLSEKLPNVGDSIEIFEGEDPEVFGERLIETVQKIIELRKKKEATSKKASVSS